MYQNEPTTVSEANPSPWLKASDLSGRTINVRIESHQFTELRQMDGSKQRKLTLVFAGKEKKLVANPTQQRAIAELLGSESFADWHGKLIALAPGKTFTGVATIVVKPPTMAVQRVQPAQPATTAADEEFGLFDEDVKES